MGAVGEDLDVNCDGADGVVVESFYVASDGDDEGPGSPTRPLSSIGEALARAAESLEGDTPRPHVFIASGNYTESVTVPDGVRVASDRAALSGGLGPAQGAAGLEAGPHRAHASLRVRQ